MSIILQNWFRESCTNNHMVVAISGIQDQKIYEVRNFLNEIGYTFHRRTKHEFWRKPGYPEAKISVHGSIVYDVDFIKTLTGIGWKPREFLEWKQSGTIPTTQWDHSTKILEPIPKTNTILYKSSVDNPGTVHKIFVEVSPEKKGFTATFINENGDSFSIPMKTEDEWEKMHKSILLHTLQDNIDPYIQSFEIPKYTPQKVASVS